MFAHGDGVRVGCSPAQTVRTLWAMLAAVGSLMSGQAPAMSSAPRMVPITSALGLHPGPQEKPVALDVLVARGRGSA